MIDIGPNLLAAIHETYTFLGVSALLYFFYMWFKMITEN